MASGFRYLWTAHRRLAIAAIALGLLLALVGVAHAPFVRTRVLALAVERLRADAGIDARIERLDYNLLTLGVSIGRTSLTAVDAASPFLTLDGVQLNLPWSIVTGTLVIESLEIFRPSVTIVRAADGRLNLPAAQDDVVAEPSAPLGPVDIGRLAIRDLRVGYADRPGDLSLDGASITLEMSRAGGPPLSGRLSMSGAIEVVVGERKTTMSRLEGGLGFNGSTLALDALTVEAPEARLRLDGTIDLLAADPQVDARYEGRLHLDELAPWVAPGENLSGAVDVEGTAVGALDAPELTFAVSATDVAWRDERRISVDLRGEVSTSAAIIEHVRLGIGDGTITGSARVGLVETERSRAELTWTRLDLGAIARTAGVSEPRLSAIAQGRITADWTGSDPQTATAAIELALGAARGPADTVAVGGRLAGTLGDGQWRLAIDGLSTRTARIDGEVSGRLGASDITSATLSGQARIAVEDLQALVRELGRAGVEVPSEAPVDKGRLALAVTLAGTIGAPSAAGTLEADGLHAADLGPGALDASFSATSSRVELESLRFVLGPDNATGNLAIDLERRTVQGAFAADLPRLAPLAGMLPPEFRPEGSASARAEVGGTLDSPSVRFDVTGADIRVAGQHFTSVELTGRLLDQRLAVERLQIGQDAGQLDASGSYSLDTGRYGLKAAGRNLAVRPVATPDGPLPVDARFDLDVEGEGTLGAPQGHATIAVRDLRWGDYVVGAAHLNATLAGDDVRIDAAVPSLQATLAAGASLVAPRRFTARMAIDNADIEMLLRRAAGERTPDDAVQPLPLTGAITAVAVAEGDVDRLAEAVASLDLRLVDVTAGGAPISLDRPGRLRYDAGRIVAEDFALRSGSTSLTAQGQFGGAADPGLTLELDGGLADFMPFAHLAPGLEGLDAAGAVKLVVRAAGSLDAPRVNATMSLADATLTLPDLPVVTGLSVQAAFDDGLLTLEELGARWQGATLTATGSVPATILGTSLPEPYARTLPPLPDRASARIVLESITAAMAEPFVDAETLAQIEAQVAATITVEATSLELEAVRADVTFDRLALMLAGEPLAQDRPTTLKLAGGRLDVTDWSWSGGGNRLSVAGGADLAGASPALEATLSGNLDLRMIGAVSPDLAAGGQIDFQFAARGPVADPVIEGELTVRDGEVAIRDPRVALTELRGTIAVAADRVRVVDLRASANGGTLAMSGEITIDNLQPTGGSLDIQGRGLALEVPENLRSELNLDLKLNASDPPELAGTVTVLRGSYRAPISLTGQLLSGVQVEAVVPTEPTLLDRLRLSINVVSQESIVVDNNYGKLEIETDLKVVGTPSLPALAGRLTIGEGGAVFLGGQTWALERGTVDFTNPTLIEPNMDLQLSTRVQYYDVRLSVSGTPNTLEANLSSPDGISQADAVSLLLTGQLADQQSMAQTEIARGQLLLLLSGELLGFAGRAVGLDSAQVGRGLGGAASSFDLLATDTDPSARLTVTKQLRRDVELVFSQSLRDSNDLTWIALYRPIKAIELRTTTLDDNARTYEFRHELNFGGRRPRVTAAARAPESRVSSTRWTGSPGFTERELRDRVKLDDGDRFDFYRWQQDQDRLTDFYVDQGYLEARIRARREPGESAGGELSVALTYDIDRGAETTLVIEGATLPGGVVDEMRDSWARSMFDGFLRADMEALARRSLAGDGYLQAEVRAEIREDVAAGTKQVVVRIAQGPRTPDRRLAFEGQQRVSDGDLEEVLRRGRLELTAWLDPREVEGALEAHYRTLGYQSARVSIGEPVFVGTTARLPVTVVEGPQFHIASVEITGVDARPLAEIRKAFGVEPGMPYVPGTLEPARREVELAYLREGYNDVRVSVTSVADAELPAAHLAVEVKEGPQQVLEEVTIAGADTTSAGTVRRALDLEVGKPAELGDTYQAQKRLYDTGVFRRADVELQPIGEAVQAGTQPVRAAVTLEETPLYRFRYGVRLTDDTGPAEANREFRPGLVADLLRRNLFGRALSTGVAGQVESNRRLVRGILTAPQFFTLPVTSSLFLTQARQNIETPGSTPFVQDISEATAEQRFNPRSNMAVSYSYRFLRTHAFELDPSDTDTPFDLRVHVARLTSTFAWDTRDDPFNARNGWLQSSGFEWAVPSLGSDLRFLKLILQQFYFKSVGDVVLASAVRVGTAWGFEAPLLFSERYFVGGGTSLRGFAENGVGRVDFLNEPVGGASSLILNQELRFPLYKWVRGVGFVDAGNIFPRAGDLSLNGLEYGAGLGLRIDTPFGLARIDYGMPLTSRSREPFGRWYFSLGQAF